MIAGCRVLSTVGIALVIQAASSVEPDAQRADASARPVTFNEDIAPLIREKCGPCHRPEGAAPFSLLTYADVRQRVTQIATVTRSRFMPPWKAEPGYGDFIGQQPLTAREIDLIQHWMDGGAPEGPPRDLPPLPHAGPWQHGTPDLIVRLPEPYTLRAGGADVFRTFVVPLPIDGMRYVRGLEVRPDNPRIVHHANIRIDRTSTSRALDKMDPLPGHEGMARSSEYPDGHVLGWTFGQVVAPLPKGLAWRLDPGTDLVLQLHLQPSGKPEVVQLSLGLYFSDTPPERTPSVLRLSRQDFDIPAGAPNYTIRDSYTLPVDVEVLAVQPHAHYRGRQIRATASLPNGATRWLLYIRDWDFRWQHVYRYVKPPILPKGTTITMEYTYDNSAGNPRNPEQPPKRARYGWESADEMGDFYVQVFTRDERDRTVLEESFRPKSIAEDIAGYENLLERRPANAAVLHNDVAVLNLEIGRQAKAIAHFESAVRLEPDLAERHFNLAVALRLAGRSENSIRRYQEAIRIKPDMAVAHNHLGNLFLELGRADDAVSHFREAVRWAPQQAASHNNLGLALMQRDDALNEAASHFREAIRIDPAMADAHYNLGHLSKRHGRLADAIAHLQQAVRLRPDDAPTLMTLAWILATSPDETQRDAERAVDAAERAAAVTGRQDAEVLDVLAAAYAAAGQFDRAVSTTQEALRLGPDGPLTAAIQEREQVYRRHQPYREQGAVAEAPRR